VEEEKEQSLKALETAQQRQAEKEAMEAVYRQLVREKGDLEKELVEVEQRARGLDSKLLTETDKLTRSDDTLKRLESDHAALQEEKKTLEGEAMTMTNQIAELDRKVLQLQSEGEVKDKELTHLRGELKAGEQRHATQEEESRQREDACEQAKNQLREQLRESRSQFERDMEKLHQESNVAIAALEADKAALQKTENSALMKVGELQGEIDHLQDEIRKEHGLVAQRRLKEAYKAVRASQVAQLQKDIAMKLAQEVQEKKASLDSVEGLYHKLHDEKETADAQVVALRGELETQSTRRRTAEREAEEKARLLEELQAKVATTPAVPSSDDPVHVYLEKLVQFYLVPVREAVDKAEQVAISRFITISDRLSTTENAINALSKHLADAEARVLQKVGDLMEQRLVHTIARLQKQLDGCTRKSELVEEQMRDGMNAWKQRGEDIKAELMTSLETCHQMLLSRHNTTQATLEDERKAREELKHWFSQQLSEALALIEEEGTAKAKRALDTVEDMRGRRERELNQAQQTVDKQQVQLERRLNQVDTEITGKVTFCQTSLHTHADRLDRLTTKLDQSRQDVSDHAAASLKEHSKVLDGRVEGADAKSHAALQREADSRRHFENELLRKHSLLDAGRLREEAEIKEALQKLRDQHNQLAVELHSEVAQLRSKLEGRSVDSLAWIETGISECRATLSRQAQALVDMCGITATSMQDASLVMRTASPLTQKNR